MITSSIHASFHLFFGGGFSHVVFSLFPRFIRDLHLHFVLGYLTWPSSRDPSFFACILDL